MKNAVIGIFMVIILIFSGISIQTAENRTARKNELDNILGTAMEQSMKILTVNPVYYIEKEGGSDEFVADFIQGFVVKTTSDSDISLEILDVDAEKGLLDVRAVETYKQIIGYGKITCRKTVILDDLEKEEDVFYQVSFLTGEPKDDGKDGSGYVLKQVSVHGGDSLTSAILPKGDMEKEGYIFCGWKMVKPVNGIGILYGEENIGTICARDDIEFQAVYQREGKL